MHTPYEIAKTPPSCNRPVPFWSWNDKLEAEECVRQIELMHEQGIGGFFMHARGGLLTEYLSREWFEVTNACIQAAERLGMNAWAYDEDGWPSGFGGGLVNGKGLIYQQKYLRIKEIKDAKEAAEVEHRIAVYDKNGQMVANADSLPSEGGLAAYFEVNPYYVDTLDGKVIAEFLHSTHEKYYDVLPQPERKAMRGFFTDEPQISRNGTPWSFILETEYRQAYGDELLPRLPQLFYEIGDDYRQTRHRFWLLITRLFSENFMHQIQNWCHAHGWQLTGHLVLEETLHHQICSNGVAMPHYEYFDIPGMDNLGRYFTWVTCPLGLFSAAAQTGRRQILSETFALCGWAVSFADLKWLAQWQYVHGVNFLCQHLEGYSLRGIRKRDYPASLFIHQPWWDYYKPFNDYFSRLGTLLAAGDVHYRTLLLQPGATSFTNYNDRDNGKLDEYDQAFHALTDLLEASQVNHHYGDEELMRRHGKVSKGELVIGAQSYDVVILPKLSNLGDVQFTMLKQFAEQGGRIYGLRNDLEHGFYVAGVDHSGDALLAKVQWFDSAEALVAALPADCRAVGLRTPEGRALPDLNATSRSFADFDGKPAVLYYIVNNNREKAFKAVIRISGKGLERYDVSTGEVVPLAYHREGDVCVLEHRFEAVGDLVLLARDYEVPAAATEVPVAATLPLGDAWQIVGSTENLLTLDHCRCEAEGKELFAHEYVLTIHDELLKFERPLPIVLEYAFEVDEQFALGTPVDLLVEHPERQKILVNGQAVSNVAQGFFRDKAFERIAIGPQLKCGRNVIRLEGEFFQTEETYECIRRGKIFESEKNKLSYHSEIEAVYLAGDFGVATPGVWQELTADSTRYTGNFALTVPSKLVQGTDVGLWGRPFFSGALELEQTVELTTEEANKQYAVRFSEVFASVLEVTVNGQCIGALTMPDYELAIPAGMLKPGANVIRLKLVTSLRNMLGPHHLQDGDSHGVCPYHFYKTPGGVFTPHDAAPWNDGYCFVKQGVKTIRNS
ncbi:MAG: hypothetical protein IKS83_04515 [Victivallales bacterium]|nr:hypothetical protein [Victivallales bacterium]